MPDISLVPLIRAQRELYDIPRGPERFRKYLDVMIGGSGDSQLPLSDFNPMGRSLVADRLDALLDLGAERLAAEAIEGAGRRLAGVAASFRLGLVLVDDAGGGWTNRSHVELENHHRPTALLKRGWAVALAWTSEAPDAEGLRRVVLATIYRAIGVLLHGEPRTLGRIMAREGFASAFASEPCPDLDDDEVMYTREVIRPHRGATDLTTIIPCLFGDRAARTIGNDAFGLSDRAGLSLALAEAIDSRVSPEEALRATSHSALNS